MITASELKDKIAFERSTITYTQAGDAQTTWTQYLSTLARVKEKSGGYSFETGKVNSKARIEIKMRFRPAQDIRVGDRVKWRGFSWIIENSPISDEYRTSIYMMATIDVANTYRTSEV